MITDFLGWTIPLHFSHSCILYNNQFTPQSENIILYYYSRGTSRFYGSARTATSNKWKDSSLVTISCKITTNARLQLYLRVERKRDRWEGRKGEEGKLGLDWPWLNADCRRGRVTGALKSSVSESGSKIHRERPNIQIIHTQTHKTNTSFPCDLMNTL